MGIWRLGRQGPPCWTVFVLELSHQCYVAWSQYVMIFDWKLPLSINLWCTIGGYCLHYQGTMCWYQFLCLYWQCEFILLLYFCFNRSDQGLIVSSMHGPTILESMQLLKWSELVFVRDSQGSLDTVTWFLLIIWGGMDNNFHPSIYWIDDFKILPVFISIMYIFHFGQLYIRASC